MFFKNILPALIWALFILIITLMPGKYIPPASLWDFIGLDKFVHAFIFAVLLVLFSFFFVRQYSIFSLRSNAVFVSFLICLFYSVMLEVIQGAFLKDRYFEVNDVAANVVGCVFGIFIYKFVKRKT